MTYPALALLEYTSIAAGIAAGDAMVKRAPVATIQAGTVQPGHYLVLIAGDVASVGEALTAGRELDEAAVFDSLFLPNVHPDVVSGLTGGREPGAGEALGVIETRSVAAAIRAADAGVKGAEVELVRLRLADGLGGKGLTLFAGLVSDVEAAVAIAAAEAGALLLRELVVAQLHEEMWPNVLNTGRFGTHFGW
ncbi:MAG: BMC domain-containing protein [Anaerolineales bacterium]|nr:BMC domain-containing protein [Anaerolineales bacterium]MCB0027495.1 BMC domain-containing protein [Anaerolineales bacterium]